MALKQLFGKLIRNYGDDAAQLVSNYGDDVGGLLASHGDNVASSIAAKNVANLPESTSILGNFNYDSTYDAIVPGYINSNLPAINVPELPTKHMVVDNVLGSRTVPVVEWGGYDIVDGGLPEIVDEIPVTQSSAMIRPHNNTALGKWFRKNLTRADGTRRIPGSLDLDSIDDDLPF